MFSKKEVDNINKRTLKDRVGEIKKDRNIFLFVGLALMVTTIYQSCSISTVVENTKRTREIVYVKLQPNGSYSVSEALPEDEQAVSTPVINSLLSKYVDKRFGVHKETVERDYAEASVFMSSNLVTVFMDEKGFNAREKIKSILSGKSDTINIKVLSFDHYDVIEGKFDNQTKPVVRSTIEYQETTVSNDGKIKAIQKKRLRTQWSLLERAELSKQSLDWLNINPVGLVILDETEENI
ncbi:VirB8/TrbF family protein [Providencia rettgeri]|uniref:VirB8/TrbF family protein n=1 Tax=Providencia rettgeri TaxID=587 RepID=UPI001FBB9EA9|nr:VirB8/TrbF family protein [Providencia rettgeri]